MLYFSCVLNLLEIRRNHGTRPLHLRRAHARPRYRADDLARPPAAESDRGGDARRRGRARRLRRSASTTGPTSPSRPRRSPSRRLPQRTERIRLTSAVSVLSSDDPVRVFQQFSTLDLLSDGRAEIMAGRGSFIESFPLFGYDLADYDELFAEKLDLLLRLRDDRAGHVGRPPPRAPRRPRRLPAPCPGACSPSGSRSAAIPPRPRARARSASRWRSPSSAACRSDSHRSPRSTVAPRARPVTSSLRSASTRTASSPTPRRRRPTSRGRRSRR